MLLLRLLRRCKFFTAGRSRQKFHACRIEQQLEVAGPSVTVLFNDPFGFDTSGVGNAFTFFTVTVKKTHDIRILLDGSGFTQVGKFGSGSGALGLVDLTVELRKNKDGDFQILCQLLDTG